MLIAVWVVNATLAMIFVAVGVMKLVRPKDALAASGLAWTADAPVGGVKTIGAVEVLGGVGLVLPLATGIATVLTPVAAIGLALIMAGAIVLHVRRKESFTTPVALLPVALLSTVLGFLAI